MTDPALGVSVKAPKHLALVASLAAMLLSDAAFGAATLRIRMGTVAPRGSVWTEELEVMRQEWRDISGGLIDLKIYPGGVLGDEPEMLRKVRAGTIEAVALSQIGLSRIDPGVGCLSIPLMLEDDRELDYVVERLAPELQRRLEGQGFVVVNWAEGGWVHFFSKRPVRTPDDLRAMKLFTSAGDPDTERLWKQLGFNVVPMSLTDMVTALQTGMIDAIDVPPLFALLDRSYTLVRYMLDLAVAPIVGGTLVERKTWEKIPAEMRPRLLESSRAAGQRLRGEVRKMGREAVREMAQRGLEVIELDAASRALWQSEAERHYPELRGRYAPADLWDEVTRLRDEYRRGLAESEAASGQSREPR